MIILGIDPGSAKTGYGVIEKRLRSKLKCVAYGCITTPQSESNSERLLILEKELVAVLKNYRPDVAGVERLFFFKNLKTVMPVSEARGVILLTLARHKIPIYEFTPLQVKMTIAGYGRAEKKQVQRMVKEILSLPEIPKPDDAADGLAMAIACSLTQRPA
jgi:crossover junction endodeoxyribonuclease RuvC